MFATVSVNKSDFKYFYVYRATLALCQKKLAKRAKKAFCKCYNKKNTKVIFKLSYLVQRNKEGRFSKRGGGAKRVLFCPHPYINTLPKVSKKNCTAFLLLHPLLLGFSLLAYNRKGWNPFNGLIFVVFSVGVKDLCFITVQKKIYMLR